MSSISPKKFGPAIRLLREQKDISQVFLANSLGIPRPSLSQLENGQRDLSFDELGKLLSIFQISYEEFLRYCEPQQMKKEVATNAKKSKIPFDANKFKQLLLYIIEKCGGKPNVGETVIYKLLYFCDFDFFELYEKPLTGMPYRRYQYGPIPDQSFYNPILNKMVESNVIARISRPYDGGTMQTKYVAFASADTSIFSPNEIEIINKVINRLSDMSARQIEDHVHHDKPWILHEDGEVMDYSSVFNREGEFAQRDYHAEFMQAGVRDSFGGLEPIEKEEYEYYINLPEKPSK